MGRASEHGKWDIQDIRAGPAVAADGAGMTAFQGLKSLQSAPLLNSIVIPPYERAADAPQLRRQPSAPAQCPRERGSGRAHQRPSHFTASTRAARYARLCAVAPRQASRDAPSPRSRLPRRTHHEHRDSDRRDDWHGKRIPLGTAAASRATASFSAAAQRRPHR